ncbi:chromate transporter [Bacillus sp. FJAT-28004]|uniref:chromate transporter n=1 Tax=Bacillus sp. FJAT-28004 TaxID=1679165 RepID=UPI0007C86702|nr:chromate transporter [Bacillus sp. FJAT-28004]
MKYVRRVVFIIKKGRGFARKMLELFWVFFCVGPVTFGGGYAMISIIEREVVGKRGWLNSSEMSDLISIAGSAPGGVGVNAAAFIGYRMGGVPGAAVAVTGITLPTFVIVFMLSFAYDWFDEYPKVIAALKGIHGAVIGLIIVAAFKIAKTSLVDKTTIGIAAATLTILCFTNIDPTFIILAGLFNGIIIVNVKQWLGIKANIVGSPLIRGNLEMKYPEYYI